MSISSSYPTQTPSLNLNFATGSDQFLDSRISYSRSSSGTAFSSERHLSSENLITQSQFSGWSELTSPTVTAAYTNGPDGSSNTATRLQSASGSHRYFYSTATSWTSGQQYTVSCWVKSNTGVAQTFAFFLPTTAYATADLTTHATDWTRITATFTAATSSIYCGFKLLSANTTDLSIWGFQVNTGANALDYQATSGSIHREFAPTLRTAAADAPRFEYSASDGQSEGLLIESQKTNLVTRSEEFDSWSPANSTLHPNAAIAPDGTLSGDLVTEHYDGTSSLSHYVSSANITPAVSTSYTFSVYLKAAGRNNALLYTNIGGVSVNSIFNLSNGTVTYTGGSVTNAISSVGNGWYRCSITWTTTSTAVGNVRVYTADSDTTFSYTGNGYGSVICWGAQVETGAASSYIKTTSSSVSRAADSCSVATSSFYTGGPVSVISEFAGGSGYYPELWELRDTVSKAGGVNDYILPIKYSASASSSTNWQTWINDSGNLSQTTLGASSSATKLGVSVDTNSVASCADGGTIYDTTSTVIPDSLDTLYIGRAYASSITLNGHIKRLSLFNVALSDTELQALTS